MSVNISSNGILFTADQYLTPGTNIEVTVSLDPERSVLLVAVGWVVHSEDWLAAVTMRRHEFRNGKVGD